MRTDTNRELIEFAGNLANELSNIVTAAYGNLGLLENAANETAAGRVAYDGARRALQRSIGVIERLRTVAGLQTMKAEPTDAVQEIEKLVEAARTNVSPGVRIRTTFPRARCIVQIDREKFRDAMGEMLSNAADALSLGGILTVEVGLVREKHVQYVRIDVCDNGVGMERPLLERAIMPLTTTKPHPSHKGWGLALCDGFARQSDGFLEISSQSGQGTCVSLFLPRRRR